MILNRCTLIDWPFVLFLLCYVDYIISSGAENDKMTVSFCLFQMVLVWWQSHSACCSYSPLAQNGTLQILKLSIAIY